VYAVQIGSFLNLHPGEVEAMFPWESSGEEFCRSVHICHSYDETLSVLTSHGVAWIIK